MDNLRKKTAIAAAIGLALYLVFFLFLDRAVDLRVHNTWSDTCLFRLGADISYSAQGSYFDLAIAVCAIFVIIRDPGLKKRWTRNLLYLCISISMAIIVGEGLKFLLGRYRPVMLFEHNLYGFTFFSSEWARNSTPSGHTLRAFSLMIALSLLFRRWTAIFIPSPS